MNHKMTTSLETLASQINQAHADAIDSARTTMAYARMVGDLLLQAKGVAGHGAWLPWLEANVKFSVRTAQGYMRIASHWNELSNTQSTAYLDEALKMLAEPKPIKPADEKAKPFYELPAESRAKMCTLWWDMLASRAVLYHAAGWDFDRIVAAVNMPAVDVRAVLVPTVNVDCGGYFTDAAGERLYRDVVQGHLHGILSTVYVQAAYAAESDGFPELESHLKAIGESHRRQRSLLPHWVFLRPVKGETIVNACAVSDARRALGIVTADTGNLSARLTKLLDVAQDMDSHLDDVIDWVAIENASGYRDRCKEYDLNPATMKPWDEASTVTGA
ncbi:MAG: DUF3102 domain-containing protein [Planctomycetia bacterium]|nr:DUF3102 domain-containing protein [Planctomycetia bacterium]